MEEDIISLTHTKWRCQYHLVFAPKYRRKIIYGKYKGSIINVGVSAKQTKNNQKKHKKRNIKRKNLL